MPGSRGPPAVLAKGQLDQERVDPSADPSWMGSQLDPTRCRGSGTEAPNGSAVNGPAPGGGLPLPSSVRSPYSFVTFTLTETPAPFTVTVPEAGLRSHPDTDPTV